MNARRVTRLIGSPTCTLAVLAAWGGVAMARAAFIHLSIVGPSMAPTLIHDQRLWVNRWAYGVWSWTRTAAATAPRRGDIVVFTPHDGSQLPSIKRVIALPGEVLTIVHNRVLVDGTPLDEPYLPEGTLTGPPQCISIAPDCYFVLGDHRECSSDSRDYGPVPRARIAGRAFLRYWPPEDAAWLARHTRT